MAIDGFTTSLGEPLELTGERFTGAASGEVKHERYHRYFFALQFCDNKVVLDIASGEGYGSALLGTVAQEVLGVDLSPEAVSRASRNYRNGRVSFTVSDYAAIPTSNASADVVVAFDTLTHVADRESFFGEIKRILRPDGMLVISTPNVDASKDIATGLHPLQAKEPDAGEFRAILSRHFSNYRLFGQRSVIGSAIAPQSSLLSDAGRQQTFRAADSGVYSVEEGIGPPTYFIAVASEAALPEIQHGLLDDRPFLSNLYDLLQKRAIAIREIEQLLRATVTNRDELQDQLRVAATNRDELQDQLRVAVTNRDELQDQLRRRESELIQLRQQFRARESELSEVRSEASQLLEALQSRDDELAQSRALVARIYSSGSWRMTLPLRFLRQIAGAIGCRSVRLADRLGAGGLFGHRVFSDGKNSEPPLPSTTEAPEPADAVPLRAASTEPETELQVLQRSGLFDEQFYREANPDVAATKISPLDHYLSAGGFEGRRPNRLFDSAYYLSTYPDVAEAGVNPALHYYLRGALEGRDPSPEFDTSFYLEANPDVVTSGVNPLVHYLRLGTQRGRFSLVKSSELQVLKRSGLFDEQFYCEANPDVAAAKISPLEHYFSVGGFEGRQPNPLFDSAYYLSTYPDVAEAGINPALHYFLTGALEGRDPSRDFDTSFYLEANPDVATSGINPLVHFLRFGAQQGRFPLMERYERELQKLGRLAAAHHRQDKLDYRPLVSVLMPAYNTKPMYLEASVRSLIAQAYSNWELRIVDDESSNPATLEALGRVLAWDKRIFVSRNARHDGIPGAANRALHDARGEYVAMLGHDDELTADALYEVVLALNADRTTDVIYTDEDYLSSEGEPIGHFWKPDWSPSLFRCVMYVGHLLTVRRSLALDAGGFESGFDPVQDFELMLRISERTRKIRHVPKVLYRCRRIPESVAVGDNANGGVERLQAAAVQAHLERLGLDGSARPHPRHSRRVFIEPVGRPPNSTFDLIVHGGANPTAGATAINGALASTRCQVSRITVPAAWTGVEISGEAKARLVFDNADGCLSDADRLSRLLAESDAEFVVALSADVAIKTDHWLEWLMLAVQEHDVAVACPAVLCADGLISHAGLVVGCDGRVMPAMQGCEPESDGDAGSLSCAREISAAWADVALLRRSALTSFLPANPVYVTADFLVADLTLHAVRSGLRAVCIPYVRAHRLVTTGAGGNHRLDAFLYQDNWAGEAGRDPFYNPKFVSAYADHALPV